MSRQISEKTERKILSKLLVRRFDFVWSNGRGYGYGNTPSQAVSNLKTRNKTIKTGLLVRVKDKGIWSYWDANKFHKALDRWHE